MRGAGFLRCGGTAVGTMGREDFGRVGLGTDGLNVTILVWSPSGALFIGGISPGLAGSMITLGIAEIMGI